MAQPTSMRLSSVTAGQLEDLGKRYGNRTTAMAVAVDRLWRDTMSTREYHMERMTADGLGDIDGFTDGQIKTILDRKTRAAEDAVRSLGFEPVWDEIRIHSTGHIVGDGPADSLTEDELEDAVAHAVENVLDAWYAEGCPEA